MRDCLSDIVVGDGSDIVCRTKVEVIISRSARTTRSKAVGIVGRSRIVVVVVISVYLAVVVAILMCVAIS